MKTKALWRVAALGAILSATYMVPTPVCTAATATPRPVQVASSAQLVLDARAQPGKLVLWITRTRTRTPISGAGNVSVRLDGQTVKVSARQDHYVVATDGLHGRKHSIEVVVAHDGIREMLSGAVMLPSTPSTLEIIQKHSGWAWWVLNIGVLLLAFRMISRRKKTS